MEFLYDLDKEIILFVVGLFFVAIYSLVTFNSWTKEELRFGYSNPPRHFTTWGRFTRFSLFYLFGIEALYILIAKFPEQFSVLFEHPGNPTIVSDSSLYAVIVVTGFLSNFPGVRKMENYFRNMLHEKAFIPAEATAIIEHLSIDPNLFRPDSDTAQNVIEDLEDMKLPVSDLTKIAKTVEHKWYKISCLFYGIRKWKGRPEVNRFFEHCAPNYVSCEEKYEKLKRQICDYGEEKGKLGKGESTEEHKRFVYTLEAELSEKLDSLLKQVYQFVSCGILTTEKSLKSRVSAFESFGLYLDLDQKFPIDWNTIHKSVGIIFASALFPTLAYYYYFPIFHIPEPTSFYPISPQYIFIWAVIGMFMFSLGLLGAIMIQRYTPRLGTDFIKVKPSLSKSVAAGFLAYFLGFSVLIVATLMSGNSVMENLHTMWLWPFLPTTTAAFTARYIQTYKKDESPRIKESLIQGAAVIIVAVIIVLLNSKALSNPHFMIYLVVVTGLIGGGIGFTLPESYRKLRQTPKGEQRLNPRFKTAIKSALRAGSMLKDCTIENISAGGALLNLSTSSPIRTVTELELAEVGKIPALLVRKEQGRTSIRFLLDNHLKEKLNSFINNFPKEAPA